MEPSLQQVEPKPAYHSVAVRASAVMVASGIFLSRIAGLVRERVFAHYFGSTGVADAYRAAFKIPNFLQNLFGEGVLSASFIPVYAKLRAEKRDREASELAEAAFSLIFLVTTLIVAVGIATTPWLMYAIAPGFHGEKRALTIHLVRILFPGTGFLVFSAWCLGILNSHRKFFLSYAAPVVWNVAIISSFYWKRGAAQSHLAELVAWGAVLGSGLQFGIQLPVVLRLLRPLRGHLDFRSLHVGEVVRNFFPVFIGRGVVQISGYVDQILASPLPDGAVAFLGYAQTLNSLPVSLFGMAVSAAELPAMSSALGTQDEVAQVLRTRLARGLEQIAFFVVPSAMAFLALGDVVVATIYKSGIFGSTQVTFVWGVLAGSAVGLLATTSGRLYSFAFYALRDTRTPLRFAVIRVVLTVGLGYLCALPLPVWLGINRLWGAAGLTLSAGIAGWLEFALLRRSLQQRIGKVDYRPSRLLRLWAAALLAAALGVGIKLALPMRSATAQHSSDALLTGVLVLVPYGLCYLVVTRLLGVGTAIDGLFRRFRRA
jgi:putative peptidoglycan lipid II flippase